MPALSTTNRWKLGLFVTDGIAAGMASLLWLGARRLSRESIEAFYFFDETVSGLDVGAPVEFRGVKIGKVRAIRAAPDRRHVEVVSELYLDALDRIGMSREVRPQGPEEGPFAPPDLRVQLISSILTGVTFIQSDFVDVERYPVPEYPFEVPWNTVHSAPSTYKSVETGLLGTLEGLPRLVEDAGHALARFQLGLEELQLADLSGRAVALMTTLEERLAGLEQLEVVQRGAASFAELEGAAAEARALLADVRREDGSFHRLATRYEALGRELELAFGESDLPATAASMRRLGDGLADASDEMRYLARELRGDLADARELLASLQRLVDLLERDPGALLHGKSPSPLPASTPR